MQVGSANSKIFELSFLWEISKALSPESNPKEVFESVDLVLKAFLDIEKFSILLFDENNLTFRYYSHDWDYISDKHLLEDYLSVYSSFMAGFEQSLVLNDKKISLLDAKIQCVENINACISCNKNKIYLPVAQDQDLIGLIEINLKSFKPEMNSYDLFLTLSVFAAQMSSEIVNTKLNEQMITNTNFYEAMKNIAKIIETQYELSYVIPLIGEMIDKFMLEHLVYVFSFEDENFKLLWPSSYSKDRLDPMLSRVQETDSPFLSSDRKIGVFPLKSEQYLLGAIVADSRLLRLSEKEFLNLEQLSQQASITISKANTYAEVLKHASIDALTGLNNRRQLEARLSQEVSAVKRSGAKLCCMMLDVDYFKSFNDRYGHAVGDFILQELAKIIKDQLREYDFASRYGGEEFCILLPSTKIDEAYMVAQRLREKVEQTPYDAAGFDIPSEEKLSITISIGLSEYKPEMNYCQELYIAADKALYQAKRNGRNRVEVL